jgi:membrane protein
MAIQPVRWPALSDWRAVLVRTWKEAGDDNVGFLAAGVAFYAFLAFVPLLASAVLIYGLAADPPTVAEHIRKLFQVLPADAAALIGDQLKGMTESPDSAKGWSLLVAIAIAIYGASKGSGAIVTALNIAYEVKEDRGFIKTTLLALVMTVGGLLVLVVAAGAISAMAAIEKLLPASSPLVHVALQILFWAAAIAAVAVGLAAAYRWAPNRPGAPWVWVSPGSAAATLLWLLASLGFGLYVSHFGNYNATYGSLGGVVVFLTWLYLSSYIVLMGGEMNSELERQQALKGKAPAEAAPPKTEPAIAAASPAAAPAAPPPPPQPRSRRTDAAFALAAGGWIALKLWRRRRDKVRVSDRQYLPKHIAPTG